MPISVSTAMYGGFMMNTNGRGRGSLFVFQFVPVGANRTGGGAAAS